MPLRLQHSSRHENRKGLMRAAAQRSLHDEFVHPPDTAPGSTMSANAFQRSAPDDRLRTLREKLRPKRLKPTHRLGASGVQSGIFPTVELGASKNLADLVTTLSAERAGDLVLECLKSPEEILSGGCRLADCVFASELDGRSQLKDVCSRLGCTLSEAVRTVVRLIFLGFARAT